MKRDAAKRLKVLLIDDDRDTIESLADAFAEYSCELRTADDGQSAIEEAAGFRPRLIVLDIGLPDMDGFDVARKMRARAELKDAWLVALTGYHDPRTRLLASEAGFDDYVVKPIDAMSIEAMVLEAGGAPSR
jgi:DNA-binding response OmpR family regulator